jgi:hypothetical protein
VLAIVPLMTGALILACLDDVLSPLLPIIAASRVRTSDIDFSSWASHTITKRIIYTSYYNKLSFVRTIPIKEAREAVRRDKLSDFIKVEEL